MEASSSAAKTSLLILTFLHRGDHANTEYRDELRTLGRELKVTLDINSNAVLLDEEEEEEEEEEEDGVLESDGHLPSSIRGPLDDIYPVVVLGGIVNNADAAAIQEVAAEMREIADNFQRGVVAQATQNLSRKLQNSPSQLWKDHLRQEVEMLLRCGVVLEQLPQERVMVALTLTLVKGVCEQAPRLLRRVFSTALHYISSVIAM